MFLVQWAVYDSQINLPVIYLMELEDTGRTSLPKDAARSPAARAHLVAQSMAGPKVLTSASGVDKDFDDLHPKCLRRIRVGPIYACIDTPQVGPIHDVLMQAHAPDGQDWSLAWTVEDLASARVETKKKGWFGSVEPQVFALGPFSGRGADTGATRTERAVIPPQRPYQVLAEMNPPGFSAVRKFVVATGHAFKAIVEQGLMVFLSIFVSKKLGDCVSLSADQMELRDADIDKHHGAALVMLQGLDHTPRVAVARAEAAERSPGIGAARRFRSTTPGLVTRSTARPEGVHLIERVERVGDDGLPAPVQASVVQGLRRAPARPR